MAGGRGKGVDGGAIPRKDGGMSMNANTVTAPSAVTSATLVSATEIAGPYTDAAGQSLNLVAQSITVPRPGSTHFYRIRSGTADDQ